MSSRAVLQGERRQISVLFADIRGSLGLIGEGDPEDAQALLDSVLSAMIAAVHRYEGTVNQVLGDGIMALFGAPLAQEDHAVRAASAALAMQQAVGRLRDPAWTERGVAPQIRVGINSGDVLIRTVRNDLSIDYRAVGSTTHMAARMEQLAAPGSILTTAETVRLGRGVLRVKSLGEIEVKGAAEPIAAYELVGVTLRTHFEATDARGLSAFSGRTQALALLEGSLRRALAGESCSVVLSGEPGIGKSRLCYELLRKPAAADCRVIECSARSYGRSTPHGMLAQLLRLILGVDDTDDASAIETKALSLAGECAGPRAQHVLVVLELLGAQSNDRAWVSLDPVQRRRHIEDSIRELFAAFCARGPCVLLFEDLHWCDSESLAFIGGLLEKPPRAPALLLGTHRKELAQPWRENAPTLTLLRLETLEPSDADALLASLIGDEAESAPLRRSLIERVGGNPFFLEECVRSLAERGLLIDASHTYERLDVPATIEALIGARLDCLPPDALEVLQAAAVIGDDASIDLLHRVTLVPLGQIDQLLSVLVGAELMYCARDLGAPSYRLRHALIQDVGYRRLLRPRRRALHERVVAAYESLYAVRLAEHLERLAEHCTRAELWEKAVAYHQLACMRATSRWSNTQAIAHIERGLLALSRSAPGRAREQAAVDLRLLALAPLIPLGDAERMIALLREAEPHARALGDERRQAIISSQLATGLWMIARHDDAMVHAEQALAMASGLGTELEETALYNMAMVHHARGELAAALRILRGLVQAFSGERARYRPIHWSGIPGVFVRTFAVSTLSLTGGFEEAQRLFEEGRAVADEFDQPHSRTMIMEEHGFALLVKGEPRAARELLTLAMEVCQRDEVRAMHAPIAARLGSALVQCGEVEAGLRIISDSMARKTYRHAAHYGLDYLLVARSEAELCAGNAAAALDYARQAAEITKQAGELAYHVCALVQLGSVLASRVDGYDEADAVYTLAMDEAERLGMRPWSALAHQGRGRLELARGLPDLGHRDLDVAASIWRDLGAPARVSEVAALRGSKPLEAERRAEIA